MRVTARATLFALFVTAGCGGARDRHAASSPAPTAELPAPAPPAVPAPPAPPAPAAPAPAAPIDAARIAAPAIADEAAAPSASESVPQSNSESVSDEGPLVGEERERDPRSETVTIKIIVDERRKAHVLWGVKDLGEAPLEIVRPRNSGPLDLVVTAPGYLPLHARAFTDRDDKLALRLYSEAEAPQLLGYRPDQEIPQNPRKKGPRVRDSVQRN